MIYKMPKDKSPKSKTMNKQQKKEQQKRELKKKSYGDGNDDDIDEEEFLEESSEDEATEVVKSKKNFKKFLNKMYPSKYSAKKAKEAEEEEEEDEEEEEEIKVTKKTKKTKKNKKNKKIVESESEEESEEEEYDDDDDDEDVPTLRNSKKFNLIFTIGGGKNFAVVDDEEFAIDLDDDEDYVDEDYDEEEEEEDEEDDEEETETEDDEDDEENSGKTKKLSEEDLDKEIEIAKNSRTHLEEMLKKDENSSFYKKMIDNVDKEIKSYEKQKNKFSKKEKTKNQRKFIENLQNKNIMNDASFFRKLSVKEQKKILEQMEEVNQICKLEKPYRLSLLESEIPPQFKAAAIKKINMLRNMEPGSGEFYKIKNWVDTFMKIPFNKYNNMSITRADGVEKSSEFLENAKNRLDDAVFGMDDAKMQIMQFVGQWISNPSATGTALAIKGPMGTGKTTLVKEGISKILGREFAFIALGGATDSSFLEGHSYTYEGAVWGQIVEILIKCQSMNPVIYFDELDKVSDTPRGEEIIGILTHLTDTSQNSEFHDKYFSEIDFDLSRCLFIFSYNDESKVNPILRDRMYRIQVPGYQKKQKQIISSKHLMPKIRKEVAFDEGDVIIPEDTIDYIVDEYTNKEEGVRNLKRCIEIIHTKLNLYRLMKPDTNLFGKTSTLKVEFPFTVTRDIVKDLIKREDNGMAAIMNTLYV
jgi:ATP-dependent Lon protease